MAAVAASCAGGTDAATIPAPLDCSEDTVPYGATRQLDGMFGADELAARATGDPLNSEITAGRFSSWKEPVSGVPFEPPRDVVCQVVAFADAETAHSVVADLDPSHVSLSRLSIAWPEADELDVDDLDGDTSGARYFTAHGPHTGGDQRLVIGAQSSGRFVGVVLAGGPGQSPLVEDIQPTLTALMISAASAD